MRDQWTGYYSTHAAWAAAAVAYGAAMGLALAAGGMDEWRAITTGIVGAGALWWPSVHVGKLSWPVGAWATGMSVACAVVAASDGGGDVVGAVLLVGGGVWILSAGAAMSRI